MKREFFTSHVWFKDKPNIIFYNIPSLYHLISFEPVVLKLISK